MSPLDLLLHLINGLLPAVGMAVLASSMAKWVFWRRALSAIRFGTLLRWAVAATVLAWALGWALTGRDGRMATYAGMVVACALSLAVAGWRGRR